MTRARVLANLGNSGTFSANADTNRVGISSANPTATLDVTGDVNVSSAATFGGNVTVGGVLTYEDVTNVDSVGVLTARLGANISGGDGLKVTANGAQITGVSTFSSAIDANGDLDVDGQTDLDNLVVTGVSTFSALIDLNGELDVDGQTDLDTLQVAGVSTFASGVGIADSIFHTGDTNTAIRFPAVDTFSIETAGSERLRITSAGALNIGKGTEAETSANLVEIYLGPTNESYGTIRGKYNRTNEYNRSEVRFGVEDNANGKGFLAFATGTNSATERLRITSDGRVLKGVTTARGNYANNASGAEIDHQIEGTSYASSSLSLVRNSDDANDGAIVLGKTRATVGGGSTVVQAGDHLGDITFAGADGTSLQHGVNIIAEVQSGVGNDDMPTDLIFKTNGGATSTTERLRIKSDGLLDVSGGIHVTENVTPTSGRGVEIFEASAGVGQIQSYNRTGSSWDELKLKGSEVRIYTASALSLDLAALQSTLYGTSDGILNLDSTNVAGSFMRFKQSGTTKCWVGSAEAMGGGTVTGDQDDLGLRAVGNIILRANGAERVRISENGNVGIATADPSYEFHVRGAGTVGYFEGTGGNGFIGIEDADDSTIGFIGVDGGDIKFQTMGDSFADKLVIKKDGLIWSQSSNSGAGNTNRGFYHDFSSPDSQSTGITMKTLGVGGGSGPFDTGVSVNAGNAGAVALLFATRNTSAGTSTDGAVYVAQFYYNGDNTPLIVHLGGDNWVTWGQTDGHNLQASWSGVSNFTFAMIMLQ